MLSKQLDEIATSLSLENLEATLSTLRKIFDNIIQHPNDEKYRQIELSNKTFSSKVWKYPACQELLKMSGWVVEDDHATLRDDSHVHIVSQLLESLDGQEDFNQPQVPFSTSDVLRCTNEEYESLISAVLNDDISALQNLLKSSHITPAGMIYSEDGLSTNLACVAILNQNIAVVEILLKVYSVDPYAADESGSSTGFQIYGIAPQTFIISFLKVIGPKMSIRDAYTGYSLLHVAVLSGCYNVVCFLVEDSEVDVNLGDNNLDTPLHIAYMAGLTDIAEYLIQHGADMMAVNVQDCIPYDYVNGLPEIIASSKTLQDSRKIHQIPGSDQYKYFNKLCNTEIEPEKAVTLTIVQFPSLTDNRPTQFHHDDDHI